MIPASPSELDGYPTRAGFARHIRRREPVLHGGTGAAGPFHREQLEEFERRGFVVVPSLFSREETTMILGAVRDAPRSMPSSDPRLVLEPDSDAMRSIFAFHALPGVLGRLASDARLVARARQILASDVYIHQSRINRKSEFDGRDFEWHSDFETWHAEDGMPSMRALSASVCLTSNTTYNGPLMVIPGSHRVFVSCVERTPERNYLTSLRRQVYGVPDRSSIASLVEGLGIEVITAEPGAVIFFDCNLLHGSPSNISPVPRTNAFLVYNSTENRLGAPTGARAPRPDHVAARAHGSALVPTSSLVPPAATD